MLVFLQDSHRRLLCNVWFQISSFYIKISYFMGVCKVLKKTSIFCRFHYTFRNKPNITPLEINIILHHSKYAYYYKFRKHNITPFEIHTIQHLLTYAQYNTFRNTHTITRFEIRIILHLLTYAQYNTFRNTHTITPFEIRIILHLSKLA